MYEVQPITTNERGDETHPAFGMVRAARVSSTPGVVLFGSELRHQHYIILTIHTATRRRDLKRDWIHPGKELIEISMSEAQWVQFISGMNTEGTSVTINHTETVHYVPLLPYEPRMHVQLDEVRNAVTEALAHVDRMLSEYEARPTKAGLRSLRHALDNVPSNVTYAAKALSEHVENTVTKARADIEAMVSHAAQYNVQVSGTESLLELESENEGDTPTTTKLGGPNG